MGALDTRNKVRKASAFQMILPADITKTKAWPELQKIGFIKIRFQDNVSHSFGAILLDPDTKFRLMTIEPFQNVVFYTKNNKSSIRVEWRIDTHWNDATWHPRTAQVVSSKILETVKIELSFNYMDSLKN